MRRALKRPSLFVVYGNPHRSTLSRFLAALDQPTVEALRVLFQKDVLARNPFPLLTRIPRRLPLQPVPRFLRLWMRCWR